MIVAENTVWEAGSRHELKGATVQIPAGVTLTVEEGVTVSGGVIEVSGNLHVKGSAENRTKFVRVEIDFAGEDDLSSGTGPEIIAGFAAFVKGEFLNGQSDRTGHVSVSDSAFEGAGTINITHPTSASNFTRNSFLDTRLLIATDSNAPLTIDSNFFSVSDEFSHPEGPTIEIRESTESALQIKHNSFYAYNGGTAIALSEQYRGPGINAQQNFWGNTDPEKIGELILDGNDGPRATVSVENSLSLPYVRVTFDDEDYLTLVPFNDTPTEDADGQDPEGTPAAAEENEDIAAQGNNTSQSEGDLPEHADGAEPDDDSDDDSDDEDLATAQVESQTVIPFETFLPNFRDGQALDASLVNGIVDQELLTGDGETGYKVSLQDLGHAGYDNALGVYEVNANGDIIDTRILIGNANSDKAAESMITDVEDGHGLGFFILQDAAERIDTYTDADSFSFVDENGETANISDGAAILLAVNGDIIEDITVFHSYSAGLNADNQEHVISGTAEDDDSVFIGFEDLTGTGDRDYEDVVFQLTALDLV